MFQFIPPIEKGVFVGSYTPVTPAGEMGTFNTNTYFLQQDRKRELAGPVSCRGSQ